MEVDDGKVAAGDAMGSRTGSEGFGDFDIIGNPDEMDVTEYLVLLFDGKDAHSWMTAVEVVKASIAYVQGQIVSREGPIKKQKINNGIQAAEVENDDTPEKEDIQNLNKCANELEKLFNTPIDEWDHAMIRNSNRSYLILNCGMIFGLTRPCDQELVDVHQKLLEFTTKSGNKVVSWLRAKKLIESVVRYWEHTTDVALNPNRTSYLKDIQELYATSFSSWTEEKIENLREIGCDIPRGFLGDFESLPAEIGFGTYLSDYIKKMEGQDPYKKILMIQGWEQIFVLKRDHNGILGSLQPTERVPVSKITELLATVINYNMKLTVRITEDVVGLLDQYIPYHQEITEYPVLDYIKNFIQIGPLKDPAAITARNKRLRALKEVFSVNAHYPFPLGILNDKHLSLFVHNIGLTDASGDLTMEPNFPPIIKCECNVGYVDNMVDFFMKKVFFGGGDYWLVGTMFRTIAYFRYSDVFNDSVIRDILYDFYGKLVSYKNDHSRELRLNYGLNGILFIAGLELLKPFTEKKNKSNLNETDKKNLIEGCFLINKFASTYQFQNENIPKFYKEYMGPLFNYTKPPAPSADARTVSETVNLYANI